MITSSLGECLRMGKDAVLAESPRDYNQTYNRKRRARSYCKRYTPGGLEFLSTAAVNQRHRKPYQEIEVPPDESIQSLFAFVADVGAIGEIGTKITLALDFGHASPPED
jgi:hypothetical protein